MLPSEHFLKFVRRTLRMILDGMQFASGRVEGSVMFIVLLP